MAHTSYLLESGGEALVVDPRRDVDEYLDLTRAKGARVVVQNELDVDMGMIDDIQCPCDVTIVL